VGRPISRDVACRLISRPLGVCDCRANFGIFFRLKLLGPLGHVEGGSRGQVSKVWGHKKVFSCSVYKEKMSAQARMASSVNAMQPRTEWATWPAQFL
jgi:hypothetical protein